MTNPQDTIHYTFIRGYIRRIRARKPKDKSFTVECAYSKGKGIDPDPGSIVFGPRDCPVCKGTGWLSLNGSPEDYKPCGTCKGTGSDPNDVISWKPCHICHGSGLVKVR